MNLQRIIDGIKMRAKIPQFDISQKKLKNPNGGFRSISLCITCMNRLYQLKDTIFQNLEDNKDYPGIEIVLVNYNSTDGLHEFVRDNLTVYIEKGILNYYYTPTPQHWHCCTAKNLAHKLAKGKILCNLDGDNFTGNNFAYAVNFFFDKFGENLFLHFFTRYGVGNYGRMCLTKEYFNKLGGYDEEFKPVGFQDFDLMLRAKATGMRYYNCRIKKYCSAIINTKDATVANAQQFGKHSEQADYNKSLSLKNIESGKLVANNRKYAEGLEVYKNFSEVPFLS